MTKNAPVSFHIHIDAAILPTALEMYARETYGFKWDDFEHELKVEGISEPVPARHLTLEVADRRQRTKVREICKDLSERARALGMKGVIQCEFIMSETILGTTKPFSRRPFPLKIIRRKVDPSRGEFFKRHELHLEMDQLGSSVELIRELTAAGLILVISGNDVTFTASGDPNSIRAIKNTLISYLNEAGGASGAKITTEATVFFSLHGIRPENTPEVVDRLESLRPRSEAGEFTTGIFEPVFV